MMNGILKDWKQLPDGREKYGLYLASREWAVLKEAVRARSGGRCERCKAAPGENVHHQTYDRKYREAIEDLVHVCRPCHEFLSGKLARDPVLDAPVVISGTTIRGVYLAGKISEDSWRSEIVGDSWKEHEGRDSSEGLVWLRKTKAVPIPDGRKLSLTGPFWRDVRNSHGGRASFSDTRGPHAQCDAFDDTFENADRMQLIEAAKLAIDGSDLVFAWINSLDCFGTLTEIGYAAGRGKIVVIAWDVSLYSEPNGFPEFWFPALFGDARIARAPSPLLAWNCLWEYALNGGITR